MSKMLYGEDVFSQKAGNFPVLLWVNDDLSFGEETKQRINDIATRVGAGSVFSNMNVHVRLDEKQKVLDNGPRYFRIDMDAQVVVPVDEKLVIAAKQI